MKKMNQHAILGLIVGILIGTAVHVLDMEWHRCNRVQLNDRSGIYYYWEWAHRPKVSHGICATMYGGDNGQQLWVVEKPQPSEPTAMYEFDSRDEAEKFADSKCWSKDGPWKAVTP